MFQNIKWTVFEKLTPVRPVLKPSLHSSVPPECSAELVVVHLRFTLPRPPQAGHLVWVLDDKLSVVSLPGDDIMVLLFPEQLQNEVPQLDLPGARARLWLVGPLWEGKPWRWKRGVQMDDRDKEKSCVWVMLLVICMWLTMIPLKPLIVDWTGLRPFCCQGQHHNSCKLLLFKLIPLRILNYEHNRWQRNCAKLREGNIWERI